MSSLSVPEVALISGHHDLRMLHRYTHLKDYGGGREPWPRFLSAKAENLRRIMQGLPDEAQHNIGYRNAWKLLTGKPWAP